ncbi:class I SAM-dependent DNA methyltransferase [Methylobacterium aerolatum]|uniref:site-specific DNA-methyltransferase (adenine-specific) n=1 Tax=Methylobacterium aerolatum TaxID=418708 RepID=A0ABU0I5X5_9HYPH|nr:DNA methyltransferase [Methylobacterium aerolatum]MDQ0450024.1 type I restriction-modification system DNA methylase subunit [Methylobacterium aerolatum]
MRLSWNEIRSRAGKFSKRWKDASYEKGETQTFYDELFHIFGVDRKQVAVYEKQVKKLDNKNGFIDLFWPGQLVVEQKSAGKDLSKATRQALDYCSSLKKAEVPRFILVSDFQNFQLFDLQERKEFNFKLAEISAKVELFGFIIGREAPIYQDQPEANIEAAEVMGAVHDALEQSGYVGDDLERFLVRLLFCLFADSTGIFEVKGSFQTWLHDRTAEDGSFMGAQLSELFQVLDTPNNKRHKNLDEDLAKFPYINGGLFHGCLSIPSFDAGMRDELLAAAAFRWERVSPAIFGSLFQSVMNREERRKLGAHYTSESNILKVIRPLFLDELRIRFDRLRIRRDTRRTKDLQEFLKDLRSKRFLDPACGCGNFLIVAYREMRQLELDVLIEVRKEIAGGGQLFDPGTLSEVNVDQFYGIEVDEFPARIAETAMWMMDHIMNNKLGEAFDQPYVRLPLSEAAHIRHGNALEFDWAELVRPKDCSYVLGNPPFRGHQWRTDKQQADMARVWGKEGQVNRLDYVTCWFKKAVDYATSNKNIRIGFVSTNSITQGEQSGILWPRLFAEGISIYFAHRTFQWNNEARGKAAVHCVIIGMTHKPPADRTIYDYTHVRSEPVATAVKTINGYLIDGPQYAIPARSKPPIGILKMHKGSQPTDGARLKKPGGGYVTTSNLIMDEAGKDELIEADPITKKWLRSYVGGDELISGNWRWCLWLKEAKPSEVKSCKAIKDRLDRVRKGRALSTTASVRAFAKYPTLFTQDRQPDVDYLAVPEVSSETREYIPIAILSKNVIASNKLMIVPGAPLHYHGILMSAMHMAWMRTVAGRLKSDYSYSPAVYNSFPWPELKKEQRDKIEKLTQSVIDIRITFPDDQLDDLYDTDGMPPTLRKAHELLDRYVDSLYKAKPFAFERERVEHLFSLYESRNATLVTKAAKTNKRAKR